MEGWLRCSWWKLAVPGVGQALPLPLALLAAPGLLACWPLLLPPAWPPSGARRVGSSCCLFCLLQGKEDAITCGMGFATNSAFIPL